MLFAATGTTVTLHALSPLAAWPWLAMAVAVKDAATKHTSEAISRADIDTGTRLLRRMRAAFRAWEEAALACETVRKGLTPAAAAVAKPEAEYLDGLQRIGRASQAIKEAQNAIQEWKVRLRARKEEFRAAKHALAATKQPYNRVVEPRKEELGGARFKVTDAKDAAISAQRAFAVWLADRCVGDEYKKHIEKCAYWFNIPAGYLRKLLADYNLFGDQSQRYLSSNEVRDIVRRRLAGTPKGILATEYRTTERHIKRVLRAYQDGLDCTSGCPPNCEDK